MMLSKVITPLLVGETRGKYIGHMTLRFHGNVKVAVYLFNVNQLLSDCNKGVVIL